MTKAEFMTQSNGWVRREMIESQYPIPAPIAEEDLERKWTEFDTNGDGWVIFDDIFEKEQQDEIRWRQFSNMFTSVDAYGAVYIKMFELRNYLQEQHPELSEA